MSKEKRIYQVGPDANLAQAVLTKYGRSKAGDSAESMSPTEVRQAGVKHLARKAGRLATAGIATVALSVGAGELVSYGIDHSPTVQYQQSLAHKEDAQKADAQKNLEQFKQDEHAAEELHRVLPDDPNIHVQ